MWVVFRAEGRIFRASTLLLQVFRNFLEERASAVTHPTVYNHPIGRDERVVGYASLGIGLCVLRCRSIPNSHNLYSFPKNSFSYSSIEYS